MLTTLRESAGLTVRDVAKATGLPSSTVGGYFGGRHLPPLKPVNVLPDLLRALGVDDPDLLRQWALTLRRLRRTAGPRPAEALAPYRGLSSFQPEHAEWFYGREQLTGLLLDKLADKDTGGMLAVVGPSGSGKSSLLRAGLIPALTANPGSNQNPAPTQVSLFTPGTHPLQALDDACALLAVTAAGAIRTHQPMPLPPVTMVIDQFEELFTQCDDEAVREQFIDAVCSTVAESGAGLLNPRGTSVVLGLRADFYAKALRYRQLAHTLQNSQVIVGPMSDEELRRAVTEPARRSGFDVEPGLVDMLLRDLGRYGDTDSQRLKDAGTLPLLSHALLTTWQLGRHGTLTISNYRAVGGIQGAVTRTAEEVFLRLTGPEQDCARRLFLRLVQVSDDAPDTRRRIRRPDLFTGHTDEPEPADLYQVLEEFTEGRLLTADADSVEIAHEALLVAWPRLRDWIDADRAGLRTLHRIRDAAILWRESDRDPGTLLRGVPLAVARDWADDPDHHADLNALEREFLEASVADDRAAQYAARRTTRRLRRLAAALTVLILLTAAAAGYAFTQRSAANAQRDSAVSRQAAIEANQLRTTDPALARQLAVAAYRIDPIPEARSSILDSFLAPKVTRVLGAPGVMQAVAVAPTRDLMATGGTDGVVQLWRLADPDRPTLAAEPDISIRSTVFSLAFSPDGRTLAVGGAGGTIQLWDVSDLARPHQSGVPLAGRPTNTVYSVAFSPDGHTLAAAGADKTVRLWHMPDSSGTGASSQTLTGFTGFVQAVTFSPDGRTLAAAGIDGSIRLWTLPIDRQSPTEGPVLSASASGMFCIAFGPQGRTLVAGAKDGTLWSWNLSGSSKPTPAGPPLKTDASWIHAVAFSPDGKDLAAAGSDSDVHLWSADTRTPIAILPEPAPVTDAVFLTDGTLVTSSADATARLWQLPAPPLPALTGRIFTVAFGPNHLMLAGTQSSKVSTWNIADPQRPVQIENGINGPTGPDGFSGSLALSPNGRLLAVGSSNGTVRLWDVSNPAHATAFPTVLTGPTSTVESIAISPDGRTLAISADETDIRLWNIADPQRPTALPVLNGPANYVFSVAFDPGGRLLAAGSADNTVRLWDVSNPAAPRPVGTPLRAHTSYVYSVAFSPDGRLLAAGSADNTITLWNITNPAKPTSSGPALTGPSNYVFSVAFSPDGHRLAAAAGDGTVWLWNTIDPARPRVFATLIGSAQSFFAVGFSPDNAVLSAGGRDQTLQLWDTDPQRLIADICATAGSPMTSAEWTKYLPGAPFKPPCR